MLDKTISSGCSSFASSRKQQVKVNYENVYFLELMLILNFYLVAYITCDRRLLRRFESRPLDFIRTNQLKQSQLVGTNVFVL